MLQNVPPLQIGLNLNSIFESQKIPVARIAEESGVHRSVVISILKGNHCHTLSLYKIIHPFENQFHDFALHHINPCQIKLKEVR
jgi:hypothetical protein